MKGQMKMRAILSLVVIIVALGSSFLIPHIRGRYQKKSVSETLSDTITIVTDYSPVNYFVEGDSIVGLSKDMVDLFQTYTDSKLNLVLESSLQKSIEGLESGEYDILARGIPITSDLKTKVLFSEPIAQTKQVLIQRKKKYNDRVPPVRSHLDLAGETIYVVKGSPAILRIRNLSTEIGDAIYYKEDGLYGEEQLAIMVANKDIDFAVCDEKIADRVAHSQPELDIKTDFGFTQLEAWPVSPLKPVLLDSLNLWLQKAQNSGELDRIYKRYIR